jgi:hypothetical protein
MTEMISYKVRELKLEIVNRYFEASVCVLVCIIRSLGEGGGGSFYIIHFLIYSLD